MTLLVQPGPSAKPSSDQARAHELVARFEALAENVQRLSLDCFDTILVRDVAEPTDVFYDLAQSEPFRRLGLSAKMRVDAESRARSLAALRHRRSEVSLAEIYRGAFPQLSDAEVQELARAEIEAEKRTCSAFEPTIALMRAAQARGVPIMIVSDTYLSEPELRELLAACIPADALAAVDRIFCSSVHGHSKTGGLLKLVGKLMGVPLRAILHVGDHALSDLASARDAGMQALQLIHHCPAVEGALRTQGIALSLVAPEVRRLRGLPRPYAALCAQTKGLDDPAALLGYVGAGPLLYAFAHFVLDSLSELEAKGARPKPLFLLRDAFLPQRVCSVLLGRDAGPSASLSRFAAYAASFRTKEDVERYLARSAGSGRLEPMVRQLLLPMHVAERITKAAKRASSPAHEFVRQVLERSTLELVLERSKAYRRRLLRYLEKRVKLEPGDTLVMVDLGYEGTVQRQLAPVLEDELGITVTGRYLLASRVPGWERDRRGLFDPSTCDDRVVSTLVEHAALLEDLCTSDDPSVVDYTEDGEAVFDEHVIDAAQYARTKTIQTEIVRFAREAEAWFSGTRTRPDTD
ncbi:MAG TPA: hypothetical protein VGQ57_16720, partial [Polyangiaceae bacterium]|nr:hypothetical protein [Polyangiaceae bacterium]